MYPILANMQLPVTMLLFRSLAKLLYTIEMKIQSTHRIPRARKQSRSDAHIAHAVFRAVVPTHGGPRIAHYTVVATQGERMVVPRLEPVAERRIHPLPIYATAVLVLSSFVFGVWFTWSARSSEANLAGPDLQRIAPLSGSIPIQSNAPLLAESDKVSDQNVLTMTMEQLENYLQVATTTPAKQAAETLRLRTEKLRAYLESKGSPLALFADTIAGLKHWRLVLAISNSESSLGRRCANNNCSGIGVMPGHPLWRSYKTKAEWAKDLDRLIEKRYKNWSLEKMNGVYNQPGSENWVYAARQILDDLQSIQ